MTLTSSDGFRKSSDKNLKIKTTLTYNMDLLIYIILKDKVTESNNKLFVIGIRVLDVINYKAGAS